MNNLDDFISNFRIFLNEQCTSLDAGWIKRKRVFDTKLLINSILTLAANRSTASYRLLSTFISYENQIFEKVGNKHFSASSFCDARKKLSPYIFVDLSQWIYRYASNCIKRERWFGRNIFAIDASRLLLPKDLEEDGFYSKSEYYYYPSGSLITVFDLQMGMLYDCVFSQDSNERNGAKTLIPCLPIESVLIGDRGFFSFELLHQALEEKVEVVFRLSKESSPSEIMPFFEEDLDKIISIVPSLPTQRKLNRHGIVEQSLTVRAVSYLIGKERYVLVTTIFDDQISNLDLAKLYRSRWDIEEHFKFLKETVQIQHFHSKNIQGVLQEIFATYFLATLSQATIVIEKGGKTKEDERYEYSLTVVYGGVKKLLFALLNAAKRQIHGLVCILKECITASEYRYRPDRLYFRWSCKVISVWTRSAVGVRY